VTFTCVNLMETVLAKKLNKCYVVRRQSLIG
jgi:hypothetical protein